MGFDIEDSTALAEIADQLARLCDLLEAKNEREGLSYCGDCLDFAYQKTQHGGQHIGSCRGCGRKAPV